VTDTPDVVAIFAALHAATVDYVVIGGVAAQAYGRRTYTKDLDVTASWQRPNLKRLAAALTALEASLRGVDGDLLGIDVTDVDQLSRAGSLGLRTRAGDLDVLVDPDGAPPYLELRARAVEIELRGPSSTGRRNSVSVRSPYRSQGTSCWGLCRSDPRVVTRLSSRRLARGRAGAAIVARVSSTPPVLPCPPVWAIARAACACLRFFSGPIRRVRLPLAGTR